MGGSLKKWRQMMVGKNIYQLIQSEAVDISKEYFRLCRRMQDDKNFISGIYCAADCSMLQHLDEDFHDIFPEELRGTCLDFSDLVKSLGIDFDKKDADLDDLARLVELVACAEDHDYSQKWGYEKFMKNARFVLDKVGLRIVSGKSGRVVIPLNCKVNHAAEILHGQNDIEEALDLLDYPHYSHRGDLNYKAKILTELGRAVEPLLKRGAGATCDNADFLLNNLGLRHNNEKGKNRKEAFSRLTKEEKEYWYDRTYETIVAVIVDEYQRSLNIEIQDFRKKFKRSTTSSHSKD